MAASSRSGVSAKIWALAVGIVLVIGLYTAGWFYAASMLKEKTLALLGDQQRHGVTAVCQDAEYRGYPFRIGLFCSKVSIDDKTNGVAATFGELRSAAQIYQPNHIVWELDGPAETRTGTGIAASSQWENFQSSLVTGMGGVDRSSTVITGLVASIISSQTNQAFDIKVGHTETHLRQNGSDLDAAITLQDTDITSKSSPQIIPRFTAAGDVTLAGKALLLAGQDAGRGLYGTKGEMRRLGIDLGNGQTVSITGPFSIGDDGRISGKLRVEIDKLSAWRDQIKASAPQLAKTVDTATKMLSAMTGGGDKAGIDLTLNNGKVILGGFIAIGEIPPL